MRVSAMPNRCTAAKKAYCPRCFYRPRYKIDDFFCDITKIDEAASLAAMG